MLIAFLRVMVGILSAVLVMKIFGALGRLLSGGGARRAARRSRPRRVQGFDFKDEEVLDVSASEVDGKRE